MVEPSRKAHYIDLSSKEKSLPLSVKGDNKVARVDCHAQVLVVDDNDFNLVTMPL